MKTETIYVQRKSQNCLETVDEFEGWGLARQMLSEYRQSDPSAHYYLSRRPCAAWKEKREP